MANGDDRSKNGSGSTDREHGVTVPAEDVLKEPETEIGKELKKMMQGNKDLIDSILSNSKMMGVDRAGDWARPKLIIGDNQADRKPLFTHLALGCADAGGTFVGDPPQIPGIWPVVGRVAKNGGMEWYADSHKVAIEWDKTGEPPRQDTFYDKRLQLSYWNQEVTTRAGVSMQAYRDVGLDIATAFQCYRRWLLRVWAHKFPEACLGKLSKAERPVTIRDSDSERGEGGELDEDHIDRLNAKLGFAGPRAWWSAFNHRDPRLEMHLGDDEVCKEIGLGWRSVRNGSLTQLRLELPPPPMLLRKAWEEAKSRALPFADQSPALSHWLLDRASGITSIQERYGVTAKQMHRLSAERHGKGKNQEQSVPRGNTTAQSPPATTTQPYNMFSIPSPSPSPPRELSPDVPDPDSPWDQEDVGEALVRQYWAKKAAESQKH